MSSWVLPGITRRITRSGKAAPPSAAFVWELPTRPLRSGIGSHDAGYIQNWNRAQLTAAPDHPYGVEEVVFVDTRTALSDIESDARQAEADLWGLI